MYQDIGDGWGLCGGLGGGGVGLRGVAADVADPGGWPFGFGDEGPVAVEELQGRGVVEDVGDLAGVLATDMEVDPTGSDGAVAADGGGAESFCNGQLAIQVASAR